MYLSKISYSMSKVCVLIGELVYHNAVSAVCFVLRALRYYFYGNVPSCTDRMG